MLTGKGPMVALIASLMLNAFLAGSLLTHFVRAHRGPEHHGYGRPGAEGPHRMRGGDGQRWDRPAEARLLRDVVQVLGGPHDARVRATLDQERPRMMAHRGRMQRAQANVRIALGAEPFDAARLSAALSELAREAATRQEEAQRSLVRLGAQLTAAERSRLRSLPPVPAP